MKNEEEVINKDQPNQEMESQIQCGSPKNEERYTLLQILFTSGRLVLH